MNSRTWLCWQRGPLSMLSSLGHSCCRTESCLIMFPARIASVVARSNLTNDRFKDGWVEPAFKNLSVIARLATEIFFPQRESLRLDSQNLTPRARQKATYAGGNEKSYGVGSKSLSELAEWTLNATRVAELTQQSGREMKEQQAAEVEAFHQREASRSLTAAREVSPDAPTNSPLAGVVEMDGGRIRNRDENGPRGVKNPHWREFQAGCVVRLQSEESAEDPRPDVPRLFLNRPKVQKLVSQLHRQRQAMPEERTDDQSIGELLAEEQLTENVGDQDASSTPETSRKRHRGPVRLMRTCVATLEGADACGRILAMEAARRGFDQASRKGFVGDGQTCNWSVWERYFKRSGYIPILDFIHLLSYVYALAMAVGHDADERWQLHVRWITALWKGEAAQVLAEWRSLAQEFDIPTEALPDNDPRRPIQRGLTYLENNLQRVDYTRYRRLGLPVTSTLMESLVKEFNLRVKGTEKFWNDPQGAEAILTVRAALLSEDGRFAQFFANRPGCRYHRRSTLKRAQQAQAA